MLCCCGWRIAYDELLYGNLIDAFPVEEVMEQHEEFGSLDGVHSEQDLAPMIKRRRLDHEEVEREEKIMEEAAMTKVDDMVMERERKRKEGWLQLPKEKRLAIRRLHTMTGHCSNAALQRMLIASTADRDVIEASKFF